MIGTRKQVRKEFARLLAAALVGTGLPAQAVYAYRIGDFLGQSPIVAVSSRGTQNAALSFQGIKAVHRLQVDIFVLYSNTNGSWNEELAEDALDDIEKAIADVVQSNSTNTYWQLVTEPEISDRIDIVEGGTAYINEQIILEFA